MRFHTASTLSSQKSKRRLNKKLRKGSRAHTQAHTPAACQRSFGQPAVLTLGGHENLNLLKLCALFGALGLTFKEILRP
jgi:hypothetical protein